jgi:hypothetical protein
MKKERNAPVPLIRRISSSPHLSSPLLSSPPYLPLGVLITGKYGLFYLVFYTGVTIFFAINYSVMYTTLPDVTDGPKTQYIIKPGT